MGKSVKLDGRAPRSGRDIADYQWVQTAGNPVTLTNSNTSEAAFTAPPVGSGGLDLTFKLTVTDKQRSAERRYLHRPRERAAGRRCRSGPACERRLCRVLGRDAVQRCGRFHRHVSLGAGRREPGRSARRLRHLQGELTAPDAGSGVVRLTFQLTVTDNLGLQAVDSVLVEISVPP